MNSWVLEFLPEAERDLAKIDRGIRRRIINKLDWLLDNFEVIFPSPQFFRANLKNFINYEWATGGCFIKLIGKIA